MFGQPQFDFDVSPRGAQAAARGVPTTSTHVAGAGRLQTSRLQETRAGSRGAFCHDDVDDSVVEYGLTAKSLRWALHSDAASFV